MGHLKLPGVVFRNNRFRPSSSKFAGQVCEGIQLHVTNRLRFQPLRTALCLIAHLRSAYSRHFEWAQLHFDRLAGSEAIRHGIDKGRPVTEILDAWQQELRAFEKERRAFFLY